jgi:LysM repeat protein
MGGFVMKKYVIVLIAVIALACFSGSILTYAKEKETPADTYYKYYTSISVEAGDSLWEIASRYAVPEIVTVSDYIKEIKKINGLEGDTIRAGEHLTIVYYSQEYK